MLDSLRNTFSSIVDRIKGNTCIKNDDVQEAVATIRDALLDADVPYKIVDDFIEGVKSEVVGKKVIGSLRAGEQFTSVLFHQLKKFFGESQNGAIFPKQPSIIMVVGLQGSGKTTSLAKMVHYLKREACTNKKRPSIMMMSVDFYRPAAIEQLALLAKQLGVDFYRSDTKSPVESVRKGYDHFKKNNYDYFFLDTAGRLHVDTDMLQELIALDKVIHADYKVLVLDAMTGQESLRVAKSFNESVGFHAAMLTKMDSDTRSGAAFSFYYAIKKQIVFIGTGEKIADIERFRPERMPGRILGKGDIKTLIEKVDLKIKKEEQSRITSSMKRGAFTLQDFYDQLCMIRRLGPLSNLMSYVPGMAEKKISSDDIEKGETEIKRFKVVMDSMTLKERLFPRILDSSRKKRIARGAGVKVDDVTILLNRFEQMKQYATLLKRFNRR